MGRVHEDTAKDLLRSFLETEAGAQAVHVHVTGLRDERWSQRYLDAVGQYHRGGSDAWPVEQISAFMLVNYLKMTGGLGDVEIVVGRTPSVDRDRETNQKALLKLPRPFAAVVDSTQISSDEGDGYLEWSEPIVVQHSLGLSLADVATGRTVPVLVRRCIEPGRVPLEIGTTAPSKTLEHLTKGMGVARWPYRSDRLRLFARAQHLMDSQ